MAQLYLLDWGNHVQDRVQLLGQHLGGLFCIVAHVQGDHAGVSHLLDELVLVKVLEGSFLDIQGAGVNVLS